MAKSTLTGLTEDELVDRRKTYEDRRRRRGEIDERPPFEDRFCLAHIGKQPDDYDGPPRYCMRIGTHEIAGGRTLCELHGGKSLQAGKIAEHIEYPQLSGMKHGMFAEVRNLIKDFDEKDQALYDWIVDEYSEAYGIEPETDPAAAYDLHRLAAEIVRAERGRGYLIKEGEVSEKERYTDEGVLVRDDEGNVVVEKSEHYLAQMMHRQDKKISSLESELLVSRKERAKQDSLEDAADAMKGFAEIGADLIGREDNEYDPEEWE